MYLLFIILALWHHYYVPVNVMPHFKWKSTSIIHANRPISPVRSTKNPTGLVASQFQRVDIRLDKIFYLIIQLCHIKTLKINAFYESVRFLDGKSAIQIWTILSTKMARNLPLCCLPNLNRSDKILKEEKLCKKHASFLVWSYSILSDFI